MSMPSATVQTMVFLIGLILMACSSKEAPRSKRRLGKVPQAVQPHKPINKPGKAQPLRTQPQKKSCMSIKEAKTYLEQKRKDALAKQLKEKAKLDKWRKEDMVIGKAMKEEVAAARRAQESKLKMAREKEEKGEIIAEAERKDALHKHLKSARQEFDHCQLRNIKQKEYWEDAYKRCLAVSRGKWKSCPYDDSPFFQFLCRVFFQTVQTFRSRNSGLCNKLPKEYERSFCNFLTGKLKKLPDKPDLGMKYSKHIGLLWKELKNILETKDGYVCKGHPQMCGAIKVLYKMRQHRQADISYCRVFNNSTICRALMTQKATHCDYARLKIPRHYQCHDASLMSTVQGKIRSGSSWQIKLEVTNIFQSPLSCRLKILLKSKRSVMGTLKKLPPRSRVVVDEKIAMPLSATIDKILIACEWKKGNPK